MKKYERLDLAKRDPARRKALAMLQAGRSNIAILRETGLNSFTLRQLAHDHNILRTMKTPSRALETSS